MAAAPQAIRRQQVTRSLTWKRGLIAVAVMYFALAFLCLLYLPNFDGILRDDMSNGEGAGGDGKPRPARHRHIRVREWLARRCASLNASADSPLVDATQVDAGLHLMTAYYDTRKELSYYVRVLATVLQAGKHDLNVHCHVPLAPGLYFTVPATVYEMNENHAMPVGAYVFSCPPPPHLQVSDSLCSVRITNGPDPERDLDGHPVRGAELPLLTVPRESPGADTAVAPQRQFTVCVPTLFGSSLSDRRLMDFVEMSRALGAQHFMFYLDDEVADNSAVTRLLASYAKRGLATLFRWRIVNKFRGQIHYHGQVLAVHHCLYWNMGLSKYAVFQDFDELLVPNPAKYPSWATMLKDIDDGSHCGFRFFSAFFEPDQGYFDAKRTNGVSRVRTKCLVRPELIFEMGIHHISKQNVEEMTPQNKEPDTALLHHYSRCTLAFESNNAALCSTYSPDTSLHAWRSEFEKLKRETVHALNGSR